MVTDEDFHGLRFTRFMLSEFSTKLLIPSPLAKHLSKGTGIATIMGRDNKIWHPNLVVRDGDMYMGGNGWKQFVHDNQLDVGYILIFRYRGNMLFSFRAFGRNTFEITCSAFAAQMERMGRTTRTEISDSEDENSNSMSDQETTHAAMNLKCHFEATLKPWNFTRSFLVIPAKFIKSSGLSREHREVLIEDLNGKLWRMGLNHTRQSTRIQIGKGWPEFARRNGLKVKDRAGFELVSSHQVENRVLHLKMYKPRSRVLV